MRAQGESVGAEGLPSGRREGPGVGAFLGVFPILVALGSRGDGQGLFLGCQVTPNLRRPCGFEKLEADVRAEALKG